MSAKHTPGPWWLDQERGWIIQKPDALTTYVIAEMQSSRNADGQLLAAAPDLLAAHLAWEAAEDARNNCDECDNEGPWEHCEPCSDRFGDAIDMRHAAIAKATGAA